MVKITKELQETVKENKDIKLVYFNSNGEYYFVVYKENEVESINGISISNYKTTTRDEILKAKL